MGFPDSRKLHRMSVFREFYYGNIHDDLWGIHCIWIIKSLVNWPLHRNDIRILSWFSPLLHLYKLLILDKSAMVCWFSKSVKAIDWPITASHGSAQMVVVSNPKHPPKRSHGLEGNLHINPHNTIPRGCFKMNQGWNLILVNWLMFFEDMKPVLAAPLAPPATAPVVSKGRCCGMVAHEVMEVMFTTEKNTEVQPTQSGLEVFSKKNMGFCQPSTSGIYRLFRWVYEEQHGLSSIKTRIEVLSSSELSWHIPRCRNGGS